MIILLGVNSKIKVCPEPLKECFHKNEMTWERYKDCLNHVCIYKAKNTGFRVLEHGIVTYEQAKLGLSVYYDKRYVLEDGI